MSTNQLVVRLNPRSYSLNIDQLEGLAAEYFGTLVIMATAGAHEDEVTVDFRTKDQWVMRDGVSEQCMPHQNREGFRDAISSFVLDT